MKIIITENQFINIVKLLKEDDLSNVVDISYWESPKGEVYKLHDNTMHIEFMKDIYYQETGEIEKDNDVVFNYAFNRGWVRYHYMHGFNGGDTSEFVIDALNEEKIAKTLRKIFKFLVKSPPKIIFAYCTSNKNNYSFSTTSSIDIFKLKRFIEKHSS